MKKEVEREDEKDEMDEDISLDDSLSFCDSLFASEQRSGQHSVCDPKLPMV
jgi:hypothetical protein